MSYMDDNQASLLEKLDEMGQDNDRLMQNWEKAEAEITDLRDTLNDIIELATRALRN